MKMVADIWTFSFTKELHLLCQSYMFYTHVIYNHNYITCIICYIKFHMHNILSYLIVYVLWYDDNYGRLATSVKDAMRKKFRLLCSTKDFTLTKFRYKAFSKILALCNAHLTIYLVLWIFKCTIYIIFPPWTFFFQFLKKKKYLFILQVFVIHETVFKVLLQKRKKNNVTKNYKKYIYWNVIFFSFSRTRSFCLACLWEKNFFKQLKSHFIVVFLKF